MSAPPTEPGFWKEVTHTLSKIVDVFTRPLDVISNAVSGRLEILLKRKPRLYVNFHPMSAFWCLAFAGGEKKAMQMSFMADFSHDDPGQTILLIDAYIKGTKPWIKFDEPIDIAPEELVTPEYQVHFMITPIIAPVGKNWTGRIIFIDQWHRRYRTKKFEFVWTGPTELPARYGRSRRANETSCHHRCSC
ncbi:MAG: hypothetical protein ABR861_14565 [Terriglobales bacterium]|jgi:hypothetical protein